MTAVLVAGGPGAGKSSVAADLRARGLRSIDADYGFARWEDPEGTQVEPPPNDALTLDWLRHHRWQWIDRPLNELLADSVERSTVVCGTAYNMVDYLARFDLVILLQIDDQTMVRRLADPRRNNDFGKTGATLEWSLKLRRRFEAEVLKVGHRCVDARMPLANVVDDVIRIVGERGIDLSGH
jgi:hypothetical protein